MNLGFATVLKTLLNYLTHSDIVIKLTLNPLRWRIAFDATGPTDLDPMRHALDAAFGPISVIVVIDDGSW